MRTRRRTTCALCEDAKSLARSHIFPAFLFRPIYDSQRRMLRFHRDKENPLLVQKAITQRLLCVDCEHFVNTQYEKPFRDYWYGKPALPRTPEKRTLLTLDDLDYRTFKLFHLLILWRSSVATLEAFTPVSLGPYEARIRQMLISGDPGPDTFVQILGVVLVDPRDGMVHDRTVMYPGDYRWEGRRMYNCMFGGCGWFYIVAKHPSIGFQEQMLTEAGRIVMPVFDLIQRYPYFSQFIARYRQMGSSS